MASNRSVTVPADILEYPPSLSLHAEGASMLTFAEDVGGRLRHIDSVPNGKQCGCICPACGEALIARHGGVRAHSFAHDSGAECRWAQETVLHRLAKHLIAQQGEFAVPGVKVVVERRGPLELVRVEDALPGQTVHPQSVALEHMLFKVRPDVVLSFGVRKLLVEIAVTHKVDETKLAKLRELGHAAVEIDLTRRRPATIGQLAEVLFGHDDRKKWLVNAKEDELRRRLQLECESRYQEQVRQYAATQEQLAHSLARENQRMATAMSLSARRHGLSVRYSLKGGGALLMYKAARGVVRITFEGNPGYLSKALERTSMSFGDNGYMLMESAWEEFLREFRHQFA